MKRAALVFLLAIAGTTTAQESPLNAGRDTALEKAMAAVAEAIPKAQADPSRPRYHFGPPAQWNNDPNGPMYYDGWYHLFYQHNPYDDSWENMHWGHARSRDMVHWEHLPIALWPSKAAGENHVFSGSMTVDDQGDPIIFYTSIGDRDPEQWAAVPKDDELIEWEKHEDNPILTEAIHGDEKIYQWRDPYVVRTNNRILMVNGGNLNDSKGGGAAVMLYEAENGALTKWKYRGVLFTHPDEHVKNIECPNFFPLEDKWVLIVSPHDRVEYFVGDFDEEAGKFHSQQRGILDYSTNYYAPNGFYDLDGRHILWGWVRGFPDDIGWDGCMTLPRSLSLDANMRLIQRPAGETKALRKSYLGGSDGVKKLPNSPFVLPEVQGEFLEIHAKLRGPSTGDYGLRVRCDENGEGGVAIRFANGQLAIDNMPIGDPVTDEVVDLDLAVYVDRSVIEVYAFDGREVATKVAYPEQVGEHAAFFHVAGEPLLRSWGAWALKPVMQEAPMVAWELTE